MTDAGPDRHDEINCLRESLPGTLWDLIAGRAWHENTIGCSHVRVFRLDGGLYLKLAPRDTVSFVGEYNRLAWLSARQVAVPQPLFFGSEGTWQFLLMTEVRGLPSFDDHFRVHCPQRVIRALAEGLRGLHDLDISDCPFDCRVHVLIAQAHANVAAGRIDPANMGTPYQGRTAQDLLDEVIATRPATEDLVFAHGDYCMPNILCDPQTVALTGFIDLGSAGVADRYLDLALAARSITFNWGAQWVPPFFAAYGIGVPDAVKIAFFKLIDELVWMP